MHAQRTQEGTLRKNIPCRMLVFCTYSLVSIDTLAHTLNTFVTCLYKYQVITLHDCTNIRIFPDGKVFNFSMPYINTVQYY